MDMEEYFQCSQDNWLNYLLADGDCLEEWGLCDESTDFLYFPHRKTKVEKNQEDTLERPQCIKEDEDDAVVPDRNCKPPFIFREPEEVKVHFLGLKKEYEKVQSRVNRQSRQRLTDGKVRIMVTADAQIAHIDVHVERTPMATTLCGDVTGKVPLKVKMGGQVVNKQYLSVDLDSVYLSKKGTPVYKLSTVDAERRNQFRLVVTVQFIDGARSRSFVSPSFLLRSRRPERKRSC
ncbi:hypothetical protein AWC38_SpisGene11829 [Stylophora pistillata]|uniref:Uncharacterized protein n=1 Tax=Stylophora pistillata TaxID=50429 RepID=A0A2B4S3J7_STYPI|nr:hypothetical protein AWC38_SpisGene11829 [Stylophora pistillata]